MRKELQDKMIFENWYITAKPGSSYIYYKGLLGMESKSKFTSHIKHTVWKYALQGRIYLIQRKIMENDYDYIAVKAKNYNEKLVPTDYDFSRFTRKIQQDQQEEPVNG